MDLKNKEVAIVVYAGNDEIEAIELYGHYTVAKEERRLVPCNAVEGPISLRFLVSSTRMNAYPTSEPSLYRVIVEGKFI